MKKWGYALIVIGVILGLLAVAIAIFSVYYFFREFARGHGDSICAFPGLVYGALGGEDNEYGNSVQVQNFPGRINEIRNDAGIIYLLHSINEQAISSDGRNYQGQTLSWPDDPHFFSCEGSFTVLYVGDKREMLQKL